MIIHHTNTDIEFINIGKKIQQARLIRSDYSRVFEIIKCYNENKNKLIWSAQHDRDEFRKAIKYAIKYLHEDYKYRVLSEDDIKIIDVEYDKYEESFHGGKSEYCLDK